MKNMNQWTKKNNFCFTDLKFWKTSKFSGDEVSQFSLAGNQSDIENTENSILVRFNFSWHCAIILISHK